MRGAALVTACAALILVAGCDDMIHQRKHDAWTRKGGDPATPPGGTVQFEEKPVAPPPVTLALLQRGQDRFHIYCTPCHSELGDGQGMIVQRGFSAPPNYEEARLRAAPTQHFYDVMTHGWGAMYSFAQRVPPEDRWAIAAYLRALQLSQHATLADATPAQRQALEASR